MFIFPVDDELDNELSTGTVIAISVAVTFIITLVVTALICIIITSLYCKYRYELKEKVQVDDDKNVTIVATDAVNATTAIKMDTGPTYGNAIKTDTNPAYAATYY